MALVIGIICFVKQNALAMAVASPGNFIYVFCLLIIFANVIYFIIRKCRNTANRIQMPEGLHDIFEEPTNQ